LIASSVLIIDIMVLWLSCNVVTRLKKNHIS